MELPILKHPISARVTNSGAEKKDTIHRVKIAGGIPDW